MSESCSELSSGSGRVGRMPVGSSACKPCRLGWAVAVGTLLRLWLSLGEPPDTLRGLPRGSHMDEEEEKVEIVFC